MRTHTLMLDSFYLYLVTEEHFDLGQIARRYLRSQVSGM